MWSNTHFSQHTYVLIFESFVSNSMNLLSPAAALRMESRNDATLVRLWNSSHRCKVFCVCNHRSKTLSSTVVRTPRWCSGKQITQHIELCHNNVVQFHDSTHVCLSHMFARSSIIPLLESSALLKFRNTMTRRDTKISPDIVLHLHLTHLYLFLRVCHKSFECKKKGVLNTYLHDEILAILKVLYQIVDNLSILNQLESSSQILCNSSTAARATLASSSHPHSCVSIQRSQMFLQGLR